MYNLFLSFIVCLIVFYLFLVLYLKCKMPFWSKQPVFHWYNLGYWLGGAPGLIDPNLPLINKYVDLFNIKTFSLTDMTKESIDLVCEFIKENYICANAVGASAVVTNAVVANAVVAHAVGTNTNAVGTNAVGTNTNAVGTNAVGTRYTPTQVNILAYLQNSNHPSYITVYQEPSLLLTQEAVNIVAVISARPLYVRLHKKSLFGKKKTLFTTYYVDNLCVHPAYRKKGIAATMIQTHYYNLRQQNKRLNTCLFKREGDLNAIVPLVAFKTYCLPLANIVTTQIAPLHTLIEIGVKQLYLLIEFIKSQMGKFNCVILPDVTNLTHLLKTGNIRVYCLVGANAMGANAMGANAMGTNAMGANAMGANVIDTQDGILACYIFRILALAYDGQQACECIATLNTTSLDLFQYGFKQATTVLQEKEKTALLLLEETAHTHQLMTPALHALVTFTSPTAFFFYNYACRALKGVECFIIY
jgi:GNAT superfamily N-acetyltransferase